MLVDHNDLFVATTTNMSGLSKAMGHDDVDR
jgi:hypothetical protein